MRVINYSAKAEHYSELASRAAYAAATCPCPADRAQWEERASQYDERAAAARHMARRAA